MKLWTLFSVLFLLSSHLPASPVPTPPPQPPKVCVRSYPAEDANSPCIRFPEAYAFAQEWKGADCDAESDVDVGICTRIYADSYCQKAPKEYRKVRTIEEKLICSLDYNQKAVANFCESLPNLYQYALGAVLP